MAKKVALINMKGGVGKSTFTVNLAWFFARQRKRVLVVDLDPQFNASQYLLGPSEYLRVLESGQRTVWDVFEQNTRTPQATQIRFDIHEAIYARWSPLSGRRRLDVILSRLELAFSLKTPYQQKERELSRALSLVESEYDLILIDCAPTESILTTAAYLSSDYLLVPVKPEYLSSIGLPLLVQSMNEFKESYDSRRLKLAGIVFNTATDYIPEERDAKEDVRRIAQRNRWYVFEAEVRYSRSYPKGARLGRSILGTPHAHQVQKARLVALGTEFARRIKL